jgi:hypothetical protein
MFTLAAIAVGAVSTITPRFPAYYEVKHHTQPADHFNSEDAATFQQRYLFNATWWGGSGSPIIFYTGAEGTGVEAIFSHSGYVLDMARELRAMVVFAEMRFFGSSESGRIQTPSLPAHRRADHRKLRLQSERWAFEPLLGRHALRRGWLLCALARAAGAAQRGAGAR